MLSGFLSEAEQDALALVRCRAGDLLDDLQVQIDSARLALYASDAGPEVASAIVINGPRAAELLDVANLTITADRLRTESAAYGAAAPAVEQGERGAGKARSGRAWMRRRL